METHYKSIYNIEQLCKLTYMYKHTCTNLGTEKKEKKKDITKNPYPFARSFYLVSFESDIYTPLSPPPIHPYGILLTEARRDKRGGRGGNTSVTYH